MSGIIVGILASIVCFCFSVYFTCRSFNRLNQYSHTNATVARYHLTNDDGTTYHPVLVFKTENGEKVTAISPYGSSKKDWPVGSVLRITYNPENPHQAEIVSFGPLWLFPLVFAFFAIAFAFAAWSSWTSST